MHNLHSVLHGAAGDAQGGDLGHRLMFGAGLAVGSEQGIEFIAAGGPIGSGRIARIANEIFSPYHREQGVPDSVGESPARDVYVVIGSTGVAGEESREFAIATAHANTRRRLASII